MRYFQPSSFEQHEFCADLVQKFDDVDNQQEQICQRQSFEDYVDRRTHALAAEDAHADNISDRSDDDDGEKNVGFCFNVGPVSVHEGGRLQTLFCPVGHRAV